MADAVGRVIQERDFVVHVDRDLGAHGARIAPPRLPRDGVAAADDRLLFLGDEVVELPEPRERAAGGKLLLFGGRGAEDSQELPDAHPPVIGDSFDVGGGYAWLVEPGQGLAQRHEPSSLRPPPTMTARASAIHTAALGSLHQLRGTRSPRIGNCFSLVAP